MDFILLVAWFIVAAVFLGVPGFYFLQMKRQSTKPWNLHLTANYMPSIAIFVPVHNEEKTIRLKLENLKKVEYPSERAEITIVNDASSDNTMDEVNKFAALNPSLHIKVFDSKEHLGKTGCLNKALLSVKAEIVVISDADCFWPSDILAKALPYLSDPTVGAITARELLLNPAGSWVTLGEQFYDSTVQAMRLGESKTHSTLFFQGGFAAFKRDSFNEFNHATDDSGTALDVIQKKRRALLISDVGFYTTFPTIWKNKISMKIRRASQLQHLWAKCFNLFLHGNLAIPKKIALPEIFIYIFNPLLLVGWGILSVFVFVQNLYFLGAFALIFCLAMVVKRTRLMVIELLQNNLILFAALSSFFGGKEIKLWATVQESRFLLTDDLLREKRLI
jgi:cellulose synthase/poly-beta-1,6-N-acetylglucosamine synthase-like glycosyltransferase